MKPLKLVMTPTRNRRLNELIGLVLLVGAGLLFLALASYHPADPSLNTVTGSGAHPRNWIGLAGATVSDLLFQVEGLAAFLLPVLVGALGWTWMRSRPAGSPPAKALGAALTLVFAPALLGLLPGHLLWMGALPIAGLAGRLAADGLVEYLNFPGAVIVAASMVAVSLYLSTAFSFNTAREWFTMRLAFFFAWRDRMRNWRADRAQKRAEKESSRIEARRAKEASRARKALEKEGRKPGNIEEEPFPVARRGGFAEVARTPLATEPQTTPTLWNQMPRTNIPDPEPELPQEEAVEEAPNPRTSASSLRSSAKDEPQPVLVGERAEADARKVTVAPKSVSGFRLPASTLLHRSDEAQIIREDELRDEAKVLVEKCAEFDVLGQVVQINPGPVVTTFEFRPEAGVKYSRVTGLAEDLCLAMRREHSDRAHGGKEHSWHPGSQSHTGDDLAARRN